jgi:hypothetical protein
MAGQPRQCHYFVDFRHVLCDDGAMIHIWRLSEAGPDNLGLACSDEGLILGRTPLIERRDGRFVVRERTEIERLLKRVHFQQPAPAVDRLMPGLATVAAALNANDLCLAHIAAVHLKIPALPDADARYAIEIEDALIKLADWNPDLHPRAGTPPNPGWFAPTEGLADESSSIQIAQNDDRATRSDASASPGNGDRVKLPPGEYIDELHDFLEWLANAKPEDEAKIRAEIKRYFYDVGDTLGGDTLNRVLGDVLDAGGDKEWRQQLLNSIAAYAKTDPAEIAQARSLAIGAILLLLGRQPTAATVDAPSEAWKFGWAARGQYFDKLLRDGSLPYGFRTIDNFTNGVATSIKSIDLNAATYQDAARLTARLSKYVDQLANYEGGFLSNIVVESSKITGRVLNLVIPSGSMTATQREVIEAVRSRALLANGPTVKIILTPL